MSHAWTYTLLCLWAAAALQLLPGRLAAQEAVSPSTSNASPADVARISPFSVKSRVAIFRELLALNDREREERLTSYSPPKREGLRAKIKEYELLTPEQRELRLLLTELQEYLLPLMASPTTNRAQQIAVLPTNVAPMVQIRLQHWDSLSPQQQKEVLENKRLLQYLTDFASTSPLQQNQVLTNMTPAQRQALQEALANWQRLTPERRQEITRNFNEYFRLTADEQEKTLSTVSEAERAQIEKTVRQFYELNPRSKMRVRAGLEKLCLLKTGEFTEFLRNVERWRALTPTERQAWRDLVTSASIQPPYPPGMKPQPRTPPLPGEAGASQRLMPQSAEGAAMGGRMATNR